MARRDYLGGLMTRRSAGLGLLTGIVESGCGWIKPQIGIFSNDLDIGETRKHGSSRFSAQKGQYTVNGAGSIEGKNDAFHFLWRKASSSIAIAADVIFTTSHSSEGAKSLLMIRQSLEPDSAYVAVVLRPNGFCEMQCRPNKGAKTFDFASKIRSPPRLRLERSRDVVTAYGGPPGLERTGIVSTVLPTGPVYVGLGVCSGEAKRLENALFSRLEWFEDPRP